eukprot:Gb_36503 [translate_table: standard]
MQSPKEENALAQTKSRTGSEANVSIWKFLECVDSTDFWLMMFGTLGSVADGMSTPVAMIVLSKLFNTLGNDPSANPGGFIRNINKSSLYLVYMAAGLWVAAFLGNSSWSFAKFRLQFFNSIAEAFCWTRTGERQASRMRMRYLKDVLRQDVGFFDIQGTSTSQVVNTVSNDILLIQDVLSEKVPNFIMNTATFLSSYAAAFYLEWKLTLVGFPFVTFLIIPGILYGRILVGIARNMHAAYNMAGNVAEQALSSIRTVYSFVGEQKMIAKFSAALESCVKLGLKQGLVKGIAIGSNGVVFVTWAFLCWYGSRLVMYRGVSGGMIFAAGGSLLIGGLALGTALPNIKHFSEAFIAFCRILEMMERVPTIDSNDREAQILQNVSGEIEFKNVEFAYPSRPENTIFYNFCLTIPPSQRVALVGGSGAGKSTAIALLERFYDPVGGEILLDGVNIKTLQLKWLRDQMGLVSQEPALFATSIKENILFGKEGASMDQLIAAAKSANAHNFISNLPEGYDTLVGERGVQMSGGQKQRIAIARAMLKDPRILLFDEATSALDAESEKIVQDALDQASLGLTTVVIAHRLSTIRNADLIAVVQAGHVIESGSHEDLVHRKDGAYSNLVHLQHAASKTDEVVEGEGESRVRNTSGFSKSSSNRSASGDLEQVEDSQEIPALPFRRLLLLNASEWKQGVMGCVGAIGFGAVSPVHAFTLASMISMFFLKDDSQIKSKTRTYALVFSSLGVVCFITSVLQHYNFASMGEFLTKRVRELMFSKILSFEVGWFDEDQNSSGAICSRLATEANVRSLVGDRLSLIVQTLSTVIIAFTMGLVIAWRLAIVMIAVQPMIIACYYTRQVLLKTMSAKALKAQDKSSQLAAEAVTNIRTITAFSSQERILRLFAYTQEGPRRDNNKQSWFAGLVLGTSQCLHLCNSALDFWYGGHLVEKGYITSDALFKTYFILIITGQVIADAGSMTSDLAKGSNAVRSVFAVIDRRCRINPDDEEGMKPDKIEGNVEVKNVDFAYPSRPILFRTFCLRIKAGSSVALVGQSGSGKSTIIGLIERFYDPLRGIVKIDGRDIKTYNLRCLRGHIGLVGQEPTLFEGSIRENIIYGKENATEAEIIEAAQAANAHEFISCLDKGYDTDCGERGVQLSGGQKQRIAIARAIIKNPSILLLDEATSALDSQSEKVVQEALDRIMVGRTSIVVAHRLGTIQNADFIAVIEDGMIVEQGSHNDLINKGEGSSYFSLIKLQAPSHIHD